MARCLRLKSYWIRMRAINARKKLTWQGGLIEMNRRFLLLMLVLALSAGTIYTQDKPVKKTVVVNQDGSYSVIEYPTGKEVAINLVSTGTVTGKGTARVIRTADGTRLMVNMT